MLRTQLSEAEFFAVFEQGNFLLQTKLYPSTGGHDAGQVVKPQLVIRLGGIEST